MKALTSIALNPEIVETQRAYLYSWHRAGLEPVSLNHPSEIEWLSGAYPGVQFVPTERTALAQFGRHYVRINAFLDWIVDHGEPTLLINADLLLKASAHQFAYLERLCDAGLPYLLQYNIGGSQPTVVEPCGFSAFIVHPRLAQRFAESFLCMGQPWWDYWLPYVIAQSGLPLYCPETPFAYHLRHGRAWPTDAWVTCALELARLAYAIPGDDRSIQACSAMSAAICDAIVQHTTTVALPPESAS